MSIELLPAVCPVCQHGVAVPFFQGGLQPLATQGWPESPEQALGMPRLPHDFVQCPRCSHVWNRSFTYDAIPYRNNPSRMFNQGGIWQGHLALTRDLLLRQLPDAPVIVDIGCGEGHFVRGLAAACEQQGRFVGFDPNATEESGRGVEFHARYFEPLQDMRSFAVDAIAIRHVLEHLTDPAQLLDQLAWGSAALGKPCLLFVEVPCIDRVFTTRRLADFFYEHFSHFTTASFRQLLERAGEILEFGHGYDGEVVYALVRLQAPGAALAETATQFCREAECSQQRIRAQLDVLAASGQRVAIWGGTGKAAAFINRFGADAQRFPLVVDSDPDKAGTFVPGTGQEIRFRDLLKQEPVDVVIVPTQWRARDIVAEMAREGIVANVLIEHDGCLLDFAQGQHPYQG